MMSKIELIMARLPQTVFQERTNCHYLTDSTRRVTKLTSKIAILAEVSSGKPAHSRKCEKCATFVALANIEAAPESTNLVKGLLEMWVWVFATAILPSETGEIQIDRISDPYKSI